MLRAQAEAVSTYGGLNINKGGGGRLLYISVYLGMTEAEVA